MKDLFTETIINASVERVWDILLDFASYPQWNPFIRRIVGEPVAGHRLTIHMQPPGMRAMTFRAMITRLVPNRELRWRGKLLLPGLFDGEHSHILESLSSYHTRYIQHEVFTGILVPMLAKDLHTHTRRGFEEMNRALKARAERIAA